MTTYSRFLVIGGAGFIGSHLSEALVERGPVTILDNLSSGEHENIAGLVTSGSARWIQGSVLEPEVLRRAMKRHDVVFLCTESNIDGARRAEHELGVLHRVLEAMRETDARHLVFPSSGEVYGATCAYCSEADLSGLPTNAFGASKLACEAVIASSVGAGDVRAWIFRLGEVVGHRARRGPLADLIRTLSTGTESWLPGEPDRAWPFVHIEDCISGMLFAYDRATGPLEVFNLGPGDYTSRRRLLELASAISGFGRRTLRFETTERAIERRLDSSKLDALGWEVTRTSDDAVRDALPAMLRALQPERASRNRAAHP